MVGMAAVTLTKDGKDLVVSSTKSFVDAVYSGGWRPKTGTVGSAWNTLVDDAPPGPPVLNRAITLGDLQDEDSETGLALRAAFVPALPTVGGYTYNPDGTIASDPDGNTYTWNPDGTPATQTKGEITRTFNWNPDATLASVS